jgi:hypothetical protein
MRARGACLTILAAALACSNDDRTRDTADAPDSLAPIGAGTESLLTRERLALVDQWVRGINERRGRLPTALADIHPPDSVAAQFVPLDRYLRDGWGRPLEYTYHAGTRTYEIRSPGADGIARTPDDIALQSH